MRRGERGQAAVELALCLPVLAAVALLLIQVALVVRDEILVTHAAREAAREASLTDDADKIRRAASGAGRLDPDRLTVDIRGRAGAGSRVFVTVGYASPTDLPLVGPLVGDVHLSATAAMRVES